MKDENENYEGYPDLDFLEDEDDGINKIIVVEVNDTTTDIFLETKKMSSDKHSSFFIRLRQKKPADYLRKSFSFYLFFDADLGRNTLFQFQNT